jgi:hypothetical protein
MPHMRQTSILDRTLNNFILVLIFGGSNITIEDCGLNCDRTKPQEVKLQFNPYSINYGKLKFLQNQVNHYLPKKKSSTTNNKFELLDLIENKISLSSCPLAGSFNPTHQLIGHQITMVPEKYRI